MMASRSQVRLPYRDDHEEDTPGRGQRELVRTILDLTDGDQPRARLWLKRVGLGEEEIRTAMEGRGR